MIDMTNKKRLVDFYRTPMVNRHVRLCFLAPVKYNGINPKLDLSKYNKAYLGYTIFL
jgi:hypothetical protein